MKATFTHTFLCRKAKANSQGLAPVELTITINGQRNFIALPVKENPDEFIRLRESQKSNDLKVYLDTVTAKIFEAYKAMMLANIPFTADSIKYYLLNGKPNQSYTIKNLCTEYLLLLYKRVGINLTQGVYEKYKLTFSLFEDLIGGSTEVSSINKGMILKYQTYINNQFKPSTAAGYLTRLKTVIIYALDNDKLRINPFNGIRISKGLAEIQFLTETEIQKIRDNKFTIKRLEQVKDLFLFQCFTGLAYINMATLSKEDFQANSTGQIYIHKPRVKTGVPFITVLQKDAI